MSVYEKDPPTTPRPEGEPVEQNPDAGNRLTNPLVRQSEARMSHNQMLQLASDYVKSGFLPSAIDSAEKAVIVMQTGRELGLGFMESFRAVNVISGRPALSAQLMEALGYRSRLLEHLTIDKSTDRVCTVTVKRVNRKPKTFTFTWEMASQMVTTQTEWVPNPRQPGKKMPVKKTVPLTEKHNWKTMPVFMLQWRAISWAMRVEFPDVLLGVYTPEEITSGEVVVDETGKIDTIETVEQPEQEAVEEAQREVNELNDDQVRAFEMPFGKHKGATLQEIAVIQTDKNPVKGIEYLEWVVDQTKDEKLKQTIERFFQLMQNQ